MPIYEYHCPLCNVSFEKLMKLGAATPPCISCGSSNPRKLVSAGSFVLKGGGWYKDGYTSNKGAPKKSSD